MDMMKKYILLTIFNVIAMIYVWTHDRPVIEWTLIALQLLGLIAMHFMMKEDRKFLKEERARLSQEIEDEISALEEEVAKMELQEKATPEDR